MTDELKPYGFSARVRCRDGREVTIRRKGPERLVRRAAVFVPSMVYIANVEAFTYEQWCRVFGTPGVRT